MSSNNEKDFADMTDAEQAQAVLDCPSPNIATWWRWHPEEPPATAVPPEVRDDPHWRRYRRHERRAPFWSLLFSSTVGIVAWLGISYVLIAVGGMDSGDDLTLAVWIGLLASFAFVALTWMTFKLVSGNIMEDLLGAVAAKFPDSKEDIRNCGGLRDRHGHRMRCKDVL